MRVIKFFHGRCNQCSNANDEEFSTTFIINYESSLNKRIFTLFNKSRIIWNNLKVIFYIICSFLKIKMTSYTWNWVYLKLKNSGYIYGYCWSEWCRIMTIIAERLRFYYSALFGTDRDDIFECYNNVQIYLIFIFLNVLVNCLCKLQKSNYRNSISYIFYSRICYFSFLSPTRETKRNNEKIRDA